MKSNTVTEQLTAAGRAIEHDSFAIIDAEAGAHEQYNAEQWPLVRRMIHANADFDFNGLTAFHPEAMRAGLAAVQMGGTPVVADVEMICVGLSRPRLAHFGMSTHHYISDPDVIELAHSEGTTRAVQAMRKARLRQADADHLDVGDYWRAAFLDRRQPGAHRVGMKSGQPVEVEIGVGVDHAANQRPLLDVVLLVRAGLGVDDGKRVMLDRAASGSQLFGDGIAFHDSLEEMELNHGGHREHGERSKAIDCGDSS